jgi:hypothetical protein
MTMKKKNNFNHNDEIFPDVIIWGLLGIIAILLIIVLLLLFIG